MGSGLRLRGPTEALSDLRSLLSQRAGFVFSKHSGALGPCRKPNYELTFYPDHSKGAAQHTTNGFWDLVVELQANGLAEFDRVLTFIQSVDGISSSQTSLLLTSYR
jgi:hypothetical protein